MLTVRGLAPAAVRWRPFTLLLVTFTAFALVGLQWAGIRGAGSPIWPAAGVGLAGLLLGGVRLWPAIFIGRLLAALLSGSQQPLWAEVCFAGANALSAVIPVLILRRLRVGLDLNGLEPMLRYVAYGAGVGALVSAAIGTLTLAYSSGIPRDAVGSVFLLWFSGSFAGTVTVGPLLQHLAQRDWPRPENFVRGVTATVPLVALSVAAWYIFGHANAPYLRVWHLLPLLVWTAWAGRMQTVVGLAIVAVLAAWATTTGAFVFDSPAPAISSNVLMLQQFVAIISVTGLCLSTAIDERARSSEATLRLALDGAEQGIFTYEFAKDQIIWDAQTCRLFGVPVADNLLNVERMISLVHPHDRLAVTEAVERALDPAGDGLYLVEHRIAMEDGSPRWVAVRGQTEFVGYGLFRTPQFTRGVVRDITRRKMADERQLVLTKEIAHRAKNQLAVVQSIAARTLAGATPSADGRQILLGRLHAMAGAFDLLNASSMEHAILDEIVAQELQNVPGRFQVNGPAIFVRGESVQSFALLLHELATNSLKHGALSLEAGFVEITWAVDPEAARAFTFTWRETCAPMLAPLPESGRKGFGMTLIEAVVPQQLEGEAAIAYLPQGLRYTLSCNFAAVGRLGLKAEAQAA